MRDRDQLFDYPPTTFSIPNTFSFPLLNKNFHIITWDKLHCWIHCCSIFISFYFMLYGPIFHVNFDQMMLNIYWMLFLASVKGWMVKMLFRKLYISGLCFLFVCVFVRTCIWCVLWFPTTKILLHCFMVAYEANCCFHAAF